MIHLLIILLFLFCLRIAFDQFLYSLGYVFDHHLEPILEPIMGYIENGLKIFLFGCLLCFLYICYRWIYEIYEKQRHRTLTSKLNLEHAVRRAECKGTKIPPSQAKKTLGIIYDTSFLMTNAPRPMFNYKLSLRGGIDPVVCERIYKEYFYFADHFLKAEVIPYEVLQELQAHFSNLEKTKSAKQARGRVIEMVKEGVDEVDLSGVSVSRESKSIIGADSVTDRKLIAYALFKLDNGWDYALIVTNDGGIVYDVLKLNQQGRKITTYPFEESEFFLQLTDLMGLNWRDDASWHIDISRQA